MKETLYSLIGIAMIQSILLLILKGERDERIIKLIGGAAMASVLIAGFTSFDYQTYAASLQREKNSIHWETDSLKEDVDALHRRYIESECEEYIKENASHLQIGISDVEVTLSWNTEGFWYPVHAEIEITDPYADLTQLKQLLERELGIPLNEQIWRSNDE